MSISKLQILNRDYVSKEAVVDPKRPEKEALCKSICNKIHSDDSGRAAFITLIHLYRAKNDGDDLEEKFGHPSLVKKEILQKMNSYIATSKRIKY